MASLARKARTARIHLVLSTQRPDAEFLGGEMRDNFGQRMSMGRLSPQGAMMMWENPAVRDNVATLKRRGATVVGPGTGELACGDTGAGRLADLGEIARAVGRKIAGR